MNREELKALPAYKRILSLGAVDESGPQMLKSGAFQFKRSGDYGLYNITRDGTVKRQSVQAFIIGHCDMKTLSSYNEAFNGIADKMIQIREKEKREIDLARQKEEDRKLFIQNILDGEQVLSNLKYRNLIKKLFSKGLSTYKNLNSPKELEYSVRSFVRDDATLNRLKTIPGAFELIYMAQI